LPASEIEQVSNGPPRCDRAPGDRRGPCVTRPRCREVPRRVCHRVAYRLVCTTRLMRVCQ
jgi:hypothetical protein